MANKKNTANQKNAGNPTTMANKKNAAYINWYPGHMTKARRMMEENIKLIDLVIELVDARIPLSSRNPDIDSLGRNKSRLILLNKADLASEKRNTEWKAFFEQQGYFVVILDSRKKNGMKTVHAMVEEACQEKMERDRKRGILNRPVRAMVVGIPNVGKSTFINTLAGKACTKTGNRPGVTKGKQWIRLNSKVELLDTPGILWPKFEDETVGRNLAFIGSINDAILDIEDLSLRLLGFLEREYQGLLAERYAVSEELQEFALLEEIGRNKNCLKTGGEIDTLKAAKMVLNDFRSGKLGKITLEFPTV